MKLRILMFSKKRYFDFLWTMIIRELTLRHKKTKLGVWWFLISPIAQMGTIGLVLSQIIKAEGYLFLLIIGLVIWNYFVQTVSSSVTSFLNERYLLQKSRFPREVIPLSIVSANYLLFLISLVILIVSITLAGYGVPNLIILLISILWLVIFTGSLSLLLSVLQIRFRDVGYLTQSSLTLLYYFTPIIYGLKMIPTGYYFVYYFNPLTSIVEYMRLALVKDGIVPDGILAANLVTTMLILAGRILVFRKERKFMVDWL